MDHHAMVLALGFAAGALHIASHYMKTIHTLMISYEKVTELYFQNPSFGFHFLKLISQRLLQNARHAEQVLEARRRLATV